MKLTSKIALIHDVILSGLILPTLTGIAVAADPPGVTAPFLATVPDERPAPGPAPDGMAWIPGGEFSMGAAVPHSGVCTIATMGAVNDAVPIHRVHVDGFWMDRTVITNAQFSVFVKATRYRTIPEIPPTAEEFPSALPENLYAGSTVFTPTPTSVPLDDVLQWWRYVKGADWRHPTGPESNLEGRDLYPVVQITYNDAVAYATWAGKRLPTEAEWEFAARGGMAGKPYVWGDEVTPSGKWMANIYQGQFPVTDTGADGFVGLAPVAHYPANGFGLYDMAGNVWQWCSDWYRVDTYAQQTVNGGIVRNPQGPPTPLDPAEPGAPKHVQRGGSFLCTDEYCTRYMVGARGKGDASTASNHLGFRCVRDAIPAP